MADLKLQMVIEAQNKARDEINKLKGQIEDFQGSMKKFQDEGKKAESSFGTSLKSIRGSWLAMTAAVGAAALAIRSFVNDAIEGERANQRLETLLMNVKGATLGQVEALKAQADALQRVTVVADDVIVTGQSQLATFQLQASTISRITPALLDMAVAVNGVNVTQEQMVGLGNLVGKALQGQTGVLSRYGVTLSDAQEKLLKTGSEMQRTAVLSDVLKQNFGGLAEQMRGTLEGQIAAVRNEFSDFKEEIGKRLLPVVGEFLKTLSGALPKIQASFSDFASAWGPDLEAIKDATISVGGLILKGIQGWIGALAVFRAQIDILASRQDFVGEVARSATPSGIKKNFNQLKGMIGDIQKFKEIKNDPNIPFWEKDLQAIENRRKALESLQKTQEQTTPPQPDLNLGGGGGPSLGGGGGGKDHSEEIKKHQEKIMDSIVKGRQGYRELVADATEALTKLEAKHRENTEKIDADIKKLKDSLTDLQKTYNETIKGLDLSAGEKVIEQEKKINELQKQLQENQGGGDQQAVQAQLTKEQQALANFLVGNKDLEDEIAEARRRDQITELERFAEDLKAKKEKTTEEFELRKAQAEAELLILETSKLKEQEVFEAKRLEIQNTMVQFDLFRENVLNNMDVMSAGIDTKTKIMEARLASLQRTLKETIAVEEALAARSRAGGASGGGRAFGGVVRPEEPVMVGERGPEMFVPNVAGRILPNNQIEGKQPINVSVNISGNNISNEADENRLAGKVAEMLTRALQLRQLGSS